MTAYTGEHEEYVDPSLDDYDIHKIEDKPTLTGVTIDFNHTLTDSHRADEEYGDWSESYYNSLNSVKLASDIPDLVTSLDIKEGDDIFVVWAEWTVGDSFGSSDCGEYEPFGVFKDYESAYVLESFLEFTNNYPDLNEIFSSWNVTKFKADEFITKFKSPFHVTFRYAPDQVNSTGRERGQIVLILHTPDGQQFEFLDVPWSGYFERLETVYNSEVTVQRLH
jgi:hypothetical protein